MKFLKLLSFLSVFGVATAAGAHGFYLGVGYGRGINTSMNIKQGAYGAADVIADYYAEDENGFPILVNGSSDEDYFTFNAYPAFEFLFDGYWPAYVDEDTETVLVYYDEGAWDASDALSETLTMNTEDKGQFMISAGWDFGKTPFRVELEYAMAQFGIKSYDMNIQGYAFTADQWVNWNFLNIPVGYSFDNQGGTGADVKLTTKMMNILFVVPCCENIDPYVGFGIGFADVELSGGLSASAKNQPAQQLLAGVEYAIPMTGHRVGLEYRMLNLQNLANDANDGVDTVLDRSYMSVTHNSVAIKYRYDFISDSF